MSFYLLGDEGHFDAVSKALCPLVQRHGFSAGSVRTVGPRCLQIFDNPRASAIARADMDNGTTLVALGHFIYDGAQGESALKAFFGDYDPAAPDWSKTQGHFTILLIEPMQVTVLCDGLGAHKIYHDQDRNFFSNSFLAMIHALPGARFDPLGAYEYAWRGACYGSRTFIDALSCLPANAVLRAGSDVTITRHGSPAMPDSAAEMNFESCVEHNLGVLRQTIGSIVSAFGERIRLSFSGGYDSRLLLGLLMEHGVRPELYVYGKSDDGDVRIARLIAESEGLRWRRIDKAAVPAPPPEAYSSALEEALVYYDGWSNTGLFDTSGDVADRHTRHEDGCLPLNGGLGGMYRNPQNLRDRPHTAEEVVDCFYRPYRRKWATAEFDPGAYKADMAAAMRSQLGVHAPGKLSAQQALTVYPLFRGRFWTAREAQINQRFGPMAFPYMEHRCIREAMSVPLRHKMFGKLQAAMICRVAPQLAAYPSDYGFSFDSAPGFRYRMDELKSIWRPVRLRPYLAALRRLSHETRPTELTDPYLSQVLDTQFPYTAPLFAHERIGDADTFNRVATMEYLAQRFGFAATDAD